MPGMKVFLQVLVAIPVLLITLWGVLALYFAGPDPAWLRPALASLFGVGTLALLVCLRPYRLALGIWAAAVVLLMFWWTMLQPSNDRNWQPDVARLPTGEIQGNKLTIRNLRNVDYRTETDYTVRYEDRTYDLSRLTGLDLFMIYWGSPAIAHTIMSWQFEGSLPLAVSIETRKQVGQEYSALEGFFKQRDIASLNDRATFINNIIDARSFNWTQMFMDLEHILPAGVHIISIEPKQVSGHVELNLAFGAASDDVKVKFMRALETSKQFSEVRVESEVMATTESNPGVLKIVHLSTFYSGT